MSNKLPKHNKQGNKPSQGNIKPAPKAKVAIVPEYSPRLIYILLGSILLVTFWCYHATLSNQFTNWDDGIYIYENPFVKNLSPYNLSQILFHDITQNYYHPITMLSLSLNWRYSGNTPHAYYMFEIGIHLLNTILVFFLSLALFKAMTNRGYGKIKYIPYLAGFCALLHGISPMHVESVSWIAERKDVLYLFFYLAGLIFYVKYVNGEKISWMKYANIIPIILFLWAASIVKTYSVKWTIHHSSFAVSEQLILWVLALLLAAVSFVAFTKRNVKVEIFYVAEMFLFSVTSKPLAVVFPLSLIAVDVLLRRDIDMEKIWHDTGSKINKWIYVPFRLLWEKLPLFILSGIFGYIAYVWANEGGSITNSAVFTQAQKLSFVGTNYLMYLWKYFVPTHLCSYYPYPELTDANILPVYYYFAPAAAVVITLGLLYLAYKKGENYFRIALFGFGFYFFNVMFILQYVSAGPAIMADRYSYAAYVGFTFMLVYGVYSLIDKLPAYKTPIMVVAGAFCCMLAVLCQARTEVWHNTKTLWQDVIAKYPAKVDTVYNAARSQFVVHIHPGVETAYKNLGNYYVQDINPPNYDSAYMNYEVLEETKSKDAGVYSNLGNIWALRNNIKKSLEEYTKSLNLSNKSFDTYLNRGITYSRVAQYALARRDTAVARGDTAFARQQSIIVQQDYSLAAQDYNHAYSLDSTNQSMLENRGYMLLNGVYDYKGAVADYTRLIAMDPSKPEYYKNRGLAELNTRQVQPAMEDFNKVLSVNPKDAECIYYYSVAYEVLKSYQTAIEYAQKAEKYGYRLPARYMERLQHEAKGK